MAFSSYKCQLHFSNVHYSYALCRCVSWKPRLFLLWPRVTASFWRNLLWLLAGLKSIRFDVARFIIPEMYSNCSTVHLKSAEGHEKHSQCTQHTVKKTEPVINHRLDKKYEHMIRKTKVDGSKITKSAETLPRNDNLYILFLMESDFIFPASKFKV